MDEMFSSTSMYNDIIRLPHPVSEKYPRMSMAARAAQFAPFAALTGHGARIREAERLTEPRVDLGEDRIAELDRQLQILQSVMDTSPEITVVYFRPDDRKEGGAYLEKTGAAARLDILKGELVLEDETVIPIWNITDLSGEIFGDEIGGL